MKSEVIESNYLFEKFERSGYSAVNDCYEYIARRRHHRHAHQHFREAVSEFNFQIWPRDSRERPHPVSNFAAWSTAMSSQQPS